MNRTDYDSPVPFSPLSDHEALLRYGSASHVRGLATSDDRWASAARDSDALHWRLHLALKSAQRLEARLRQEPDRT